MPKPLKSNIISKSYYNYMKTTIIFIFVLLTKWSAAQTVIEYSCKVIVPVNGIPYKGTCSKPIMLKVGTVYPVTGSLNNLVIARINDCLFSIDPTKVNVYRVNTKTINPPVHMARPPHKRKDSVNIDMKVLPKIKKTA